MIKGQLSFAAAGLLYCVFFSDSSIVNRNILLTSPLHLDKICLCDMGIRGRWRSVCASVKSDQLLFYSLP